MKYKIFLSKRANEYLNSLDSKSKRIVKENLRKLEGDPYPRPQNKLGDLEKVSIDGKEFYRMHISRTHTALYRVDEENKEINIANLVDIDRAHKMYD